jgi:hypothetical protein
MILKYRPYVMKLFGRRSTPRDGKLCTNEIKKDPDLEGNFVKGYPPHDPPPIYVRILTFFIVFHTLT